MDIRACIMEDYHGFMSHHKVLQKETDDKIAIEMVKTTQEKFPELNACSFNKGFHSNSNQTGHGTTTISQTKKANRLYFL